MGGSNSSHPFFMLKMEKVFEFDADNGTIGLKSKSGSVGRHMRKEPLV